MTPQRQDADPHHREGLELVAVKPTAHGLNVLLYRRVPQPEPLDLDVPLDCAPPWEQAAFDTTPHAEPEFARQPQQRQAAKAATRRGDLTPDGAA